MILSAERTYFLLALRLAKRQGLEREFVGHYKSYRRAGDSVVEAARCALLRCMNGT